MEPQPKEGLDKRCNVWRSRERQSDLMTRYVLLYQAMQIV